MQPRSEDDVRASFVNLTKGEMRRLALPRDLADRPWASLELLGWADPAAPQRTYLVAEDGEQLVGVALRVAPPAAGPRRSMCGLCLTTHTGGGVSLMTARKAGESGRQGNSVGVYACTDLGCSAYLRGTRRAGVRTEETITLEQKVDRLTANLAAFLGSVRLARP